MVTPESKFVRVFASLVALGSLVMLAAPSLSDPCGMVPPIYTGPGSPIKRTGLQQTYVFYDQGVESFVIRPGFEGKVDNFGMLIPFPTAPALRKVPDSVFDQIAAAVDPPEVIIDLMPVPKMAFADGAVQGNFSGGLRLKNQVSVLKQEAVGMYEVAVLEAGSAAALKRWMDQNKYQYPKGMDQVTEEYIELGWCFVAVKTKIGDKATADPQPGQRRAKPEMPTGSVFDGNVQGLGFRFRTDELVVPMRLSAFNDGDLRNVVYLLSKGGKKIRAIPEEYVVRQVDGNTLVKNLTEPLPVRIISFPGEPVEIPKWRQTNLPKERNPEPHNGIAKQIFVSDIAAVGTEDLALDHEETEKELLRIGEHFGLRGAAIDEQIESVSRELSKQMVDSTLTKLKDFTLTVVDGDFPREVLANQNLKFSAFKIAAGRNTPEKYDTKLHKAPGKKRGKLISYLFDDPQFKPGKLVVTVQPDSGGEANLLGDAVAVTVRREDPVRWPHLWYWGIAACLIVGVVAQRMRRHAS